MDDQLNGRLYELNLPTPLNEKYDKNIRLIDLIEKPLWTAAGITAADTLIPDLVAIKDDQFIIFDAKYYNPVLEKGCIPQGQPGIESIIKQYVYQLAYSSFINDHGFRQVKNCFLMPTENDTIENKGEVSLHILHSLGLQNILVRLIPANTAYMLYLSGQKMKLTDLRSDSSAL